MKKYLLPVLVVALVLLMDQWLKYWVHTNIYDSHKIIFPNWFMLYYTENNGMAFGVEFGGIPGKIILTVFRILAVFGLIWYIFNQITEKAPRGFIVCISLILAGAIGNIIDSVFYGVIFRSQNMPLFQGRVIDMLYFPIIDTYIPESFPFWKGEHFQFFRPVFNIADAAISTGIIAILVFQKSFFKPKVKPEEALINPTETEGNSENNDTEESEVLNENTAIENTALNPNSGEEEVPPASAESTDHTVQ